MHSFYAQGHVVEYLASSTFKEALLDVLKGEYWNDHFHHCIKNGAIVFWIVSEHVFAIRSIQFDLPWRVSLLGCLGCVQISHVAAHFARLAQILVLLRAHQQVP